MKQFDETNVTRDTDGKFSPKAGSTPEVFLTLLPPLTPPRQEALARVANGEVTHMLSTRFGGKNIPAHYRVGHSKVPSSASDWLNKNGFIRQGPPSLRGAKVELTDKGRAAYKAS